MNRRLHINLFLHSEIGRTQRDKLRFNTETKTGNGGDHECYIVDRAKKLYKNEEITVTIFKSIFAEL